MAKKSGARTPLVRLTLLIAVVLVSSSKQSAADTINGITSTLDAISNTAAVVEGRVRSNSYTYNSESGPRTVATLGDVTTHFGRFAPKTLQVATLGGPISEKRWLFIPELPRLTTDTRYLIFLTNVDWFYTPVVGNYIFRLEPAPGGSEILIDPSGHAVVGLSPAGLQLTADPVLDNKLDFLTPHAKSRLLEGQRSQLRRAISKSTFLSTVRELLRAVPLRGDFRLLPAAGRVWNRRTAARAAADDAAPHARTADDLVCVDPGPKAKACRDSGDNNPRKEKQP